MIMPIILHLILQPFLNPIHPLLRRLIRLKFKRRGMTHPHIHLLHSTSFHSTSLIISSNSCSFAHHPYPYMNRRHLINPISPAYHDSFLPVKFKHFSFPRKQQIQVLFLNIHHAAMPNLFLICINTTRSLLMIPRIQKSAIDNYSRNCFFILLYHPLKSSMCI